MFSDGFFWSRLIRHKCWTQTQMPQQESTKSSGLLWNCSLGLTSEMTSVIGWSNNTEDKLSGTVLSPQQLGIKYKPQTPAERKLVCLSVSVFLNFTCFSSFDTETLTQIHDGLPQQQGHKHSFLAMNFLAAKNKTKNYNKKNYCWHDKIQMLYIF